MRITDHEQTIGWTEGSVGGKIHPTSSQSDLRGEQLTLAYLVGRNFRFCLGRLVIVVGVEAEAVLLLVLDTHQAQEFHF